MSGRVGPTVGNESVSGVWFGVRLVWGTPVYEVKRRFWQAVPLTRPLRQEIFLLNSRADSYCRRERSAGRLRWAWDAGRCFVELDAVQELWQQRGALDYLVGARPWIQRDFERSGGWVPRATAHACTQLAHVEIKARWLHARCNPLRVSSTMGAGPEARTNIESNCNCIPLCLQAMRKHVCV